MVWVKMTYFHRFFRTIPGVLIIIIAVRSKYLSALIAIGWTVERSPDGPHRGGWLPSLGDSSSTAMAVRLVSVLHFYPLFSCEDIPFVFAKHVMEMIVTVVMLYIIIIKLKMSDLMTKMYKSSMISN